MTAKKKIAQKRVTLLQLAERLRNVSEACRHHGVSRSQFYEYKRAFQERGLEGLMDRPPILVNQKRMGFLVKARAGAFIQISLTLSFPNRSAFSRVTSGKKLCMNHRYLGIRNEYEPIGNLGCCLSSRRYGLECLWIAFRNHLFQVFRK